MVVVTERLGPLAFVVLTMEETGHYVGLEGKASIILQTRRYREPVLRWTDRNKLQDALEDARMGLWTPGSRQNTEEDVARLIHRWTPRKDSVVRKISSLIGDAQHDQEMDSRIALSYFLPSFSCSLLSLYRMLITLLIEREKKALPLQLLSMNRFL
ncbi:hypothetical protein NL676_000580 [Syzygium grande]|nr:hypothetical protein NL676_000580 [Syzygium grande]